MPFAIPEQRPSRDPRLVWLPSRDFLPDLICEAEVTGWHVLSVEVQVGGLLVKISR